MLGRRKLLAGAALAAARPAWAQVTPARTDTDLPPQVATVPDARVPDAGRSIDEQIDAYVEEVGFGEQERLGKLTVLRGTAIAEVPGGNPKFIAFRSLAFEQALLDAQADYVMRQNAQVLAESGRELFKAADREPPPYQVSDRDTSKASELLRKAVALGGEKVDAKLRELGVNPAEYERATEPQRYEQMRSTLISKNTEKAFGELVGLVPVQTFEKREGGDAFRIGVVAVVSPRMKDFAERVLHDRGQFTPEPARASALPALYRDKAQLVRDFGVRWRYDEAGLPVLVSFAQWMSEYRGQDPITAARNRDVAYGQAVQRADGQIADFLQGSVNVQRTAEMGQQVVEAANRMRDGYEEQLAETRKLINAYQSTIRRRSQVSVTGLATLSRWSAPHPDTGQEILGVIRIWSAVGEQQVRAQRDGRATQSTSAPNAPGPVRTGRKLMDSSDF